MKKLTALLLVVVLAVAMLASCQVDDPMKKSEGVMTYDEYMAAELNTEVVIEAYVQATQSWWDNKITVYLADLDGAYFVYEMACSKDDAAKLTRGTKIKVTGTKAAWDGEVEIVDATFTFGDDVKCVMSAEDVTSYLGNKDEMIKRQNQLVAFKGMKVTAISYKGGTPGDDIYVTAEKDGKAISFCVERYLTDPESDVYTAFTGKADAEGEQDLIVVGDTVDIEAFLYWWESDDNPAGANPHITKITEVK